MMSKIAEMAVRHNTSAHRLEEPGVPFQHYPEMAGLTVHVGANTSFRETCQACPFSAYRRVSDYVGICLRPDHHAELTAQAQAAS